MSRLKQTVVLGGLALVALGMAGTEAEAQIYCPTTVAGSGGTFSLQSGFCTNLGTVPAGNETGAFSNAALAAQALSDVSQSSSLESTQTAVAAISARRRIEVERCPDGFERVGGECQRIAAAPAPAAAPAVAPARRPARVARRAARAPAPRTPVYKAPVAPVVAIDSGRRFAVWARGFGDYERRNGTSSLTQTATGPGIGGPGIGTVNLALDSTSRATSWGIVAGADVTLRRSPISPDGVIVGLLVGYLESDVRLNVTSVSADPTVIGNGAAVVNARLSGPTVGAYAAYFNGGFSADLTFKVDLLSVGVSFTDVQGYGGAATTTQTFSGSGSTDLTNYVTVGNVQYRFPSAPGAIWIEPTAGFNYTVSRYSASAAALGLANGELFRIQGGARFGVDFFSGTTRITPTLTGLAYSDVSISGGFVSGGVFTSVPVGLADEGEVRGKGILAVHIDNGEGVSGFVQGEVRGGDRLIGYGGMAGIRIQLGS